MLARLSVVVTLLVIVLVSPAFVPSAQAQSFLGNFCWQLSPFTDTLRVSVTSYPDGIYGLVVRWRPAGNAWQFQGTGAATPDASQPGNIAFAFQAGGNTYNKTCNFKATLNSSTLSGPWDFVCPATGFINSGTLTFLSSCPAAAIPTVTAGKSSQDK
jgi:hypothetical protein